MHKVRKLESYVRELSPVRLVEHRGSGLQLSRYFLFGLLQRAKLFYFCLLMSNKNNELYLHGHKRDLQL